MSDSHRPRASRPAMAVVLAVAFALAGGCGEERGAASSGSSDASAAVPGAASRSAATPLAVVASAAPLAYFTGRIGGDAVAVRLPVPEGIDPTDWSPKAKDLPVLQDADLVVLNGAGGERWRTRVSLRESRVIETGEAVRSRWIETDGPTHSHGMSGAHSHAGTAPQLWLDPTLAIEQARAILKALSAARPERADEFARNFAALERDLLDLDARFESAVAGRAGRPVLFSHPVYDYLIRRYGLNARSLDWEPNQAPYEEQWDALVAMREEFPANALLWEAAPLAATRDRLERLGIASRTFDPAGSVRPADWLRVMRENAEALRAALD